jgi:hypothetical protein
MIKLFIILSFIFGVFSYNCPKDVCGKYIKYSQCWYNRIYNFDYCITYINKDNPFIINCIGSNSITPPSITVNSTYEHVPQMFYTCNNTKSDIIKKNRNYEQFLNIGKCYYDIKHKIKKTGNDTNNIKINCFDLPKKK